MKFRQGDRVRHPNKPDWGIGQVLDDSDGDDVRVFFVGVGEKSLSSSTQFGLKTACVFAAIILIIPTLVDKRLPSAPFRSGWFMAAVSAFVLAFVFGILGRFLFNIKILDISKLYESSLDLPEWKFKTI